MVGAEEGHKAIEGWLNYCNSEQRKFQLLVMIGGTITPEVSWLNQWLGQGPCLMLLEDGAALDKEDPLIIRLLEGRCPKTTAVKATSPFPAYFSYSEWRSSREVDG